MWRPERTSEDMRKVYKYLNMFYFLFMVAIVWCIHTSKYLDECIYAVGTYTVVDLVFMRKLKVDILIHHIFALSIIAFFCIYTYPVTYDVNEKMFLVKSVLSTEVSSIFLAANYLIPKARKGLYYTNCVVFVATFLYYRIYYYYVNIISRPQTNHFIISVSKNGYHTIMVYVGIYGLYALNLYWVPCIGAYIMRRLKSEE